MAFPELSCAGPAMILSNSFGIANHAIHPLLTSQQVVASQMFIGRLLCVRGFPVAQWQRICLPIQKTRVQFPGWEDPPAQETATHSSVLV